MGHSTRIVSTHGRETRNAALVALVLYYCEKVLRKDVVGHAKKVPEGLDDDSPV